MSNVIALAGWPPEVLAYAIAMYSRSGLSIQQAINKITEEKSSKFFETFYFQYGHASIADNAHIALALEGISQIASFEIEDEQLWDGQERSTRFQSFDKDDAYKIPEVLENTPFESEYHLLAEFMLNQYRSYRDKCFEYLVSNNPKPQDMDQGTYERTLKARAFDVARYWLFNGIYTSVGQVTSARTLEKQISRLMSSEYQECVDLAQKMKEACQAKPFCPDGKDEGPVAPTLLKYTKPMRFITEVRKFINGHVALFDKFGAVSNRYVHLVRPLDINREILATYMYESSQRSYKWINGFVNDIPDRTVSMTLSEILEMREHRDELTRHFAGGLPVQFDVCMDIGGRRDLHRHRNCIQIHQGFTTLRGFDTPDLVRMIGMEVEYERNMQMVSEKIEDLRSKVGNSADYLIPFAFRAGTLYKMDTRQAIYMTELRTKPQGHFSYREIAWEMDQQFRQNILKGLDRHDRAISFFEETDIFKR